jgi:hypothetical protein
MEVPLAPERPDRAAAGLFCQPREHVVVGSWPVVPKRDRVPFGVVASASFQWMWIADTLGFDPEWCLIGNGIGVQDAAWIKTAYPNTAYIRDSAWIRPVLVIFCDVLPPSFVWELTNLELVFHTKKQHRTLTRKWKTRLLRLCHADFGLCWSRS